MKYSIDTYRLYQSEKYFAHSVRIHVRMKDEVDINVLDKAVNSAIRRYPYFAVRVTVDEYGGYILVPNSARRASIVSNIPSSAPPLRTTLRVWRSLE